MRAVAWRSGRWQGAPEHGACAGKVDDLLPYHADAPIIRGIHFQHHVGHGLAVNLARDSEDGGCLARAGGAVE